MRILALVMALLLLPLAALAELPVYSYETSGTLVAEHQSDTLFITILFTDLVKLKYIQMSKFFNPIKLNFKNHSQMR